MTTELAVVSRHSVRLIGKEGRMGRAALHIYAATIEREILARQMPGKPAVNWEVNVISRDGALPELEVHVPSGNRAELKDAAALVEFARR